jgi:hypothetical protein
MHVPYLLQFFMDNHLYGMENVHVRRVAFRMSNWQPATTAVDDDVLTEHTTVRVEQRWWRPHLLECVCAPAPPIHTLYSTQPTANACQTDTPAVSTCELECDVRIEDVLNRIAVTSNACDTGVLNPGLRFIWRDMAQRGHVDIAKPPSPIEERPTETATKTDVEREFKKQLRQLRSSIRQFHGYVCVRACVQGGLEGLRP